MLSGRAELFVRVQAEEAVEPMARRPSSVAICIAEVSLEERKFAQVCTSSSVATIDYRERATRLSM